MKKLYVTGSHGFIGKRFCEIAKEQYLIIPVDRNNVSEVPSGSVIIHFAAKTAKSKNDVTTLAEYRRANVGLTKKLLARKPSYFLYVSTMDVLHKPLTPYAQSKLEAEALVSSFEIVRLGFVYGPGEGEYGKVIPTFIKCALAEKSLPVTDKHAARKFIYVDDVVRKLLAHVENKTTEITTIEGDIEIKILDLAKSIQKLVKNNQTSVLTPFETNLQKEIDWFRSRRVLFFDVDGTILNHWKRMYTYYAKFWIEQGFPVMALPAYMGKKRRGLTDEDMLSGLVPEKLVKMYIVWKKRPIESQEALAMDSVMSGMRDVLTKLSRTYTIVVVSARQSPEKLKDQLANLGVGTYIHEVLAVGHHTSGQKKMEAMKTYMFNHALDPGDVCIVGDTEMELGAAKSLGIPCISVTWGIRNEDFLRKHGAKLIAHTPKNLLQFLL